MIRPGRGVVRRRRAGITLTEMVVATGMATLLLLLLSTTWVTFGVPALQVDARARIEQEGILAAQSLACDLGGFLADSPGRTGTLLQYQFVDWTLSNGDVLLLNYQGASSGNVIVITYELQGNLLVRSDSSTGVTTTVARYVTGFSVAAIPDNANQVMITISIAYRNFTTTFTLIGVSPS